MQWFTALSLLTISDMSLLLFSLNPFLRLSQRLLYFRPTRSCYNLYILRGRVAHRNPFPNCQFELFISCSNDEDQIELKWDTSSYPVTSPVGHVLLFILEIIQETLKNTNGTNFFQYFVFTFNGTVVSCV